MRRIICMKWNRNRIKIHNKVVFNCKMWLVSFDCCMRIFPIWNKHSLQSIDQACKPASTKTVLNDKQHIWPAVNGYKTVYLSGKQPRFMNTAVGKCNGFAPVIGGGCSPPASLLKCSDSVKCFQCGFAHLCVLPDWQAWRNSSVTKCCNLTTVYSSEDPTVLINNLCRAIIWVSHLPGVLPWPIFVSFSINLFPQLK